MKKDTTMINLDVKGTLAKLIASENITIQHNNVQTASFNTKDRILTLPIFKEQSGDVYDMLIAHECAHALYTPQDGWEKIASDDELRSYVNVLEDTRIDKLIQKKYPGVVRNYENGFDILEKKNFFGLLGKDINKELMSIDKINLRSKSLNRLPFSFGDTDKAWLKKVDAIVTFDDVVSVAKEMLDWQKKQVEELKKLPDFNEHPIISAYDLGDEEDFDDESENLAMSDEENEESNNFGDQDSDDSQQEVKDTGDGASGDEESDSDSKSASDFNSDSDVGGGEKIAPKDFKPADKKLKSITNETFEDKRKSLTKADEHGYIYGNMPEPNFGKESALIVYKDYLSRFRNHIAKHNIAYKSEGPKYQRWIAQQFKKFNNENKKTVMYLVKEFEMKKAATAYKRASTDKTGIIDPLKLPSYKYNDDIFKKLTIIPDGKNHGMIMLLDWSGSMADTLMNTVEQLINLVQFVKKVNIPFEVYFFTSERRKENGSWKQKVGDYCYDEFSLVNCASHKMNKRELDEALTYLFSMAKDYNSRWVNRSDYYDHMNEKGVSYDMPREFNLGNTPLNEALIYMTHLVPMFRKKYGIEKLTFITLTDGGANSMSGYQLTDPKDNEHSYLKDDNFGRKNFHGKHMVITRKKKKHVIDRYYGAQTGTLLNILKEENNCNIVGFFILKRIRRWDIERYIDAKDYWDREKQYSKLRKEMTKNKSIAVTSHGYDKYFILDGKKMNVENFNMNDVTVKKATPSEFKRIFGKSMANRLVSRVVLNKFIAEVA